MKRLGDESNDVSTRIHLFFIVATREEQISWEILGIEEFTAFILALIGLLQNARGKKVLVKGE
jgi:hypothetical protein